MLKSITNKLNKCKLKMTLQDIIEYKERKAKQEIDSNFPFFYTTFNTAKLYGRGQSMEDFKVCLEMFKSRGLTHAVQYYEPIYEELDKKYCSLSNCG